MPGNNALSDRNRELHKTVQNLESSELGIGNMWLNATGATSYDRYDDLSVL